MKTMTDTEMFDIVFKVLSHSNINRSEPYSFSYSKISVVFYTIIYIVLKLRNIILLGLNNIFKNMMCNINIYSKIRVVVFSFFSFERNKTEN